MASGTGGNGCEGKKAAGEASKLPQAYSSSESGLLGLAVASMAISLAVCEPLLGLNKTTYLLSISGVFFAGVTQVCASVRVAGGPRLAGRKLVAPVFVVAGLAVASLLLLQ